MTMRKFSTCFSTITVMLIFFLQHHLVASLSPIQQKVALFQFKQSLNISTSTGCLYDFYSDSYEIDSYPKTMNWSMSSDHCKWDGVSCDQKTGNVIGLDLSCSQLEGAILPNSTLFQLSHLHFLNLSHNDFYLSNQFPQEFGSFAKGPLPTTYFQNFKAMMIGDVNERKATYIEHDLSRAFYSDSTALVIKGVETRLVRILTLFTTIDVSRNNFEGKIPEITGKLVLLRYLNLSHNYLRGHIPTSIGKLSVLESLDLSFNQLEGEIPQQLTSINTLARLNLSCNQLEGQIPKGSQFNTFDNDSYVGNIGLCGFPLSKECGHDIEMQKEGEDDDYFFSGFTWEAVVIGYGCGVVPAFIIGNLMLLAGKPKWFAGIIARELGLKIRRMEIRMR